MSQFVTRGPLIQMLIRWGTTQNLFLAYTDNLKNKYLLKNHTHVRKVGHSSEILFGIY